MTTPPDPAPQPAAPPALHAALERLARVPQLLVASDYDGVLAPIVEDPDRAVPLPGAVAALGRLAALPGTTVAVVSGRARDGLAALARLPSAVRLIGSHGAELEDAVALTPAQTSRRKRLEAALRDIVRQAPGARLETKPASVAVHTRTARAEVAAAVADAVRAGPAGWPEVYMTTGKEVVELAVVTTGKGVAVENLRTRASAGGVLFLGDDVTDEDAFAVLRAGDVGIKVGPGRTLAGHRVPDPAAAVRVLRLVRDLRAASPG